MTSYEPPALRTRLLVELEKAARLIAPLWPINTFIAVNPLWDLRTLGFAPAIDAARQHLGIQGYPSADLLASAYESGRITDTDLCIALDAFQETARDEGCPREDPQRQHEVASRNTDLQSEINREVAKWSAAHLAGSLGDDASAGLFHVWRAAVAYDPGASRLVGRSGRVRLAHLPAWPEDAITLCLDRLGLTPDAWCEEISHQLCSVPGWAGLAKWRSRWATHGDDTRVLQLIDLVAVRLAYDTELRVAPQREARRRQASRPQGHQGIQHSRPGTRSGDSYAGLAESLPSALSGTFRMLSEVQARRVWLTAYESHYRDVLLGQLERPPRPRHLEHPRAQIVCCIDPRSEGLRRHLEAVGDYVTHGFAGFFGLPLRYRAIGSQSIDLCPVLVAPSIEMAESPVPGAEAAAERRLAGEQARALAAHSFESTREGPLSAFLLAEAGGMFAAPMIAAKTLAPVQFQRLRRWVSRRLSPDAPTSIRTDPTANAMCDEEQTLFAETALRTMGFTRDFAQIVVLCGHGSTTENNPHASALDCGACGGNRGAISARAAVAILNRPEIRSRLSERGIEIPFATWFVAAEHDTAVDRVTLLDTHLVPDQHAKALGDLAVDLERAGVSLAEERSAALPRSSTRHAVAEVATRSADWAEVQPEWGLARNAAFIVGPRAMTATVNLERRAFLHSYDSSADPDGAALETILTAPMVVAHWINAQYYFSTVDPQIYGAGDKTVHNIVAGIGVTEGSGYDLKLGLPMQSVFEGGRPYHEPIRLLGVVQAPLDLIERVITRNPVLRDLFDGGWVHLAARADASSSWHLRGAGGAWTSWVGAELATKRSTVPATLDQHLERAGASRAVEAWHG